MEAPRDMFKHINEIIGNGSLLSFIIDLFYEEKLKIEEKYWAWQVPEGLKKEIEKNFDIIMLKDADKILPSGMDEFEEEILNFSNSIVKRYPKILEKIVFSNEKANKDLG